MALYRLVIAGFVIFVAIIILVVLLTGMLSTTNMLIRSPMLRVYSALISKQYKKTDVIVSKVNQQTSYFNIKLISPSSNDYKLSL